MTTATLPARRRSHAERDALALANRGLAGWVAGQLYPGPACGLSLEDLVQVGMMGLIRAASVWDSSRGTRFCTYATWWVRQAILRELRRSTGLIRLPDHLDPDDRRRLRQALAPLPLRRSRPGDDDFAGAEPADAGPLPQDLAVEHELAGQVRDALRFLSRRQRRVIEERFFSHRKLSEVAADLALSRERVRQIEAKALRRLRQVLELLTTDH